MAPTGHRVDGLRIAKARQSITDRQTGQPLKQAAFAKRLGIHPVTMSNIENGKAKVSLDLLERIASETGTRRGDLLAGAIDDDEEADPLALFAALLERAVDAAVAKRFGAQTPHHEKGLV